MSRVDIPIGLSGCLIIASPPKIPPIPTNSSRTTTVTRRAKWLAVRPCTTLLLRRGHNEVDITNASGSVPLTGTDQRRSLINPAPSAKSDQVNARFDLLTR
jgi:hypothetical protein